MRAPTRTQTAALARRALDFEAGVWRSLGRWLLRRPAVPAGAEAFSYHRMVAPVLWLWVLASGAEIVAVDLILPWTTARIVAGGLGVWGLAWMLGFLAAMIVHPHVVEEQGLRVRSGFTLDLLLPWEAVASVSGQSHDLATSMRSVQLEHSDRGAVLAVGVSGRTNVLLRLHQVTPVATSSGVHEVTAVRLWADDHRDLVRRVRDAGLAGPDRSSAG